MAHLGLRLLRNADLDRVAERILQRSWHNRKVTSSMFKMAESVETLLHLQLTWRDHYDLGRLLISSLTYAGLYRLVREEEGNPFSPYFIVATGQSPCVDNALPRKTRTDHPFPLWTSNYDAEGNRLVKPSNPSPPELEYNPLIPHTDEEGFLPWLEAVHALESVPFRINEEFLDLVKQLDANPETRIVHPIPPEYMKQRKRHDREHRTQGLPLIDKKFRENQPLTTEEDRRRRAWWRQHYLLEEQKSEFESRRAKFDKDLNAVEKLRGEKFFHRLKMCHRGRIYYPEFSYQGSDFARAVVEFDEGIGITDSGWEHLFIHTANVYGESDDVAVKLQMGEGRTGDYLTIGLDPVGEFDRWSTADKPYCFLRSCLEITDGLAVTFQGPAAKEELKGYSKEAKHQVNKATERWKETGRGVVIDGVIHFPSHMPVELDQSNSAFQHIALMMDDKELQEKANMGTINMVIPINERYRIISDSHQGIIQQARTRNGAADWESKFYFATFKAALMGLGELMVRRSKAQTLADAIDEVEKVTTTLSQALTVDHEAIVEVISVEAQDR